MTTALHQRLMILAQELQRRGEPDLATWVQKWIAHEQTVGKRRRRERKTKVRLGRTGTEAWLPEQLVKEAEEEGEEVREDA